MTGKGHEERFLTSRLSAGCGFGKETFARGRHNEEEAPFAAIRRISSIAARFG
jgi:hypothetical protein